MVVILRVRRFGNGRNGTVEQHRGCTSSVVCRDSHFGPAPWPEQPMGTVISSPEGSASEPVEATSGGRCHPPTRELHVADRGGGSAHILPMFSGEIPVDRMGLREYLKDGECEREPKTSSLNPSQLASQLFDRSGLGTRWNRVWVNVIIAP